MTLADEDTNSIQTDDGNVAMKGTQLGGQLWKQCKWPVAGVCVFVYLRFCVFVYLKLICHRERDLFRCIWFPYSWFENWFESQVLDIFDAPEVTAQLKSLQ